MLKKSGISPYLLFLLLAAAYSSNLCAFEKVIIWGHKLGTHTHSYVHNGFFIAFKQMGYSVYWFDDRDDVSHFDFSNSLFLTEGQVDKNIPLRSDCTYLLHNVLQKNYETVDRKQQFFFQVYTDDILSRDVKKIDTCIYFDFNERCLYMPWATDLLPHEIDSIKDQLSSTHSYTAEWIGTIGSGHFGNLTELTPFMTACEDAGVIFNQHNSISLEDHIQLIQNSYMAPTIVGEWQKEKGYIPCRIFKNISYGAMGITNSLRVYQLFEENVVYNPDTYQLFHDAQERLKTYTREDQIRLMEIVRDKHTYVHRIQTLLDFINLLSNQAQ